MLVQALNETGDSVSPLDVGVILHKVGIAFVSFGNSERWDEFPLEQLYMGGRRCPGCAKLRGQKSNIGESRQETPREVQNSTREETPVEVNAQLRAMGESSTMVRQRWLHATRRAGAFGLAASQFMENLSMKEHYS